MALTYSTRLDIDGNPLVSSVLASDGTVVLTGKDLIGGEVVDVDVSGDAGPTKAYQAWLAAGGKVGTAKPDLTAYAAAARYAKETGGITVGGVNVATDDRSKLLISGAREEAKDDATYTTPFVGADKVVTVLNAEQVIGLASAVSAHVRSCFSIYAAVVTDIASGKVKTTADVDAAFAAVTA